MPRQIVKFSWFGWLLLFGTFITAQDKKKLTFKLPVDVVIVNATINDKEGNPVTDLQQSDFKIYEDGKPQTIQTFAFESYEPIQPGASGKRMNLLQEGAQPVAKETPNVTRPRLISLVVDDITALSAEDFPRVAKALTKFVEENMGESDRVAVLSGSGRVQFVFSDDKQTLLEEINGLSPKLLVFQTIKSNCPHFTDLQAERISQRTGDRARDPADLSEIEDDDLRLGVLEVMECGMGAGSTPIAKPSLRPLIQAARNLATQQYLDAENRSRILLQTLRKHIRSLRHFDAAKSVILLSNGFLSESNSQIYAEMQDVVDQALESGVVLNTLDIRGLYTGFMPASESVRSVFPQIHQYKAKMYKEDQLAREAPLSRMANDTGGLFYHDNNDLHAGVQNIVRRHSSYYILSYNAPQKRSDGQYHHIKVEVARGGLELSYRKGYYVPREQMTFERRKKEDILEALRMPDNPNGIPLRLAYNIAQESDAGYALSLSIDVGIHSMRFLDEDARRRNLISLVVVAFDEMDHYVDGIEKSIDFKLTEAGYEILLNEGIHSKVTFMVPMGRYKIKAIVREGVQGKMGSVTKAIEIP
jgi:VWFA-related protein